MTRTASGNRKAQKVAEAHVKRVRRLAARGTASESELGMALFGLSEELQGDLRPARYKKVTEEAIAILRRFSASDGISDQALSIMLGQLGIHESRRGNVRHAVVMISEAVERMRPWARRMPDFYRHRLALMLVALAKSLADAERHSEAKGAVLEAVTIFESLHQSEPDRFTEYLEQSRHMRSIVETLSKRGPGSKRAGEEALAEARTRYRADLGTKNEDKLLTALISHSVFLSQVEQWYEETAVAREAFQLCESRKHRRPVAVHLHVAAQLNYAWGLRHTFRRAGAKRHAILTAIKCAVWASSNPNDHQQLASLTNSCCRLLRDLGQDRLAGRTTFKVQQGIDKWAARR